MAKSRRRPTPPKQSTVRNSRATVSGPAASDGSGTADVLAEKAAGTEDVASAFPFNPIKSAEYDPAAALTPPEGPSVKPADSIVGASTVSESNGSEKTGSGGPNIGHNPTVGPLDRVRVNSTDRALTTNQGVPIEDNQNSLKAGHGLGRAFLDQDFGDVRHVIDTNVTGTVYLVQLVGREMRDRGQGRILLTGSIAGFMPGTYQAVY